MAFDVAADAYLRFMGRFSERLAEPFARLAEVGPGGRVLDVGCGPGALTARLVERLGTEAVSAVDPSPSFVAAVRDRLPEVDVRRGAAEELPYPDGSFDAALAQLVVHFMSDPVRGLREMARVTRPGGTVATCVWDHHGERGPLTAFWRAAHELDPSNPGEGRLAGAREGHLVGLFHDAGLPEPRQTTLTVEAPFTGFDEWWAPYTLGVGPAGDYVRRLDEAGQVRLRDRCAALLPSGPFTVTASAWCVLARL